MSGGQQGEPARLASCYRRSLQVAEQNTVRRIAFPAISTGVYGYPKEAASRVAVDSVRAWLSEHRLPTEVTFCCFVRLTLTLLLFILPWGLALASPGPRATALPPPIQAPRDQPYPGILSVSVDATDVARRIVHVSEVLTGARGEVTLLYPSWIPGDHAPRGHIDRFAGLRVSAGGEPLVWTRDAVDVHAFHVRLPAGASRLDIRFDYLAPTSDKVGGEELSRDLLLIEWTNVVLYPAGFFMRQIPVTAEVSLPDGFDYATALDTDTRTSSVRFRATTVETLLDSPIYAGRHAVHLDLGQTGGAAVRLNVFGDNAAAVELKTDGLAAYRALVTQAERLFASHHYAHYDFLYSLSDAIEQNGTEHHQSSENGADPAAFTDWGKYAWERDLLPHEYVHSWNGKFRRPADLWTPNLNVPMRNSLLWVYEGQTQYWGDVLAARAGLRTREESLEDAGDDRGDLPGTGGPPMATAAGYGQR